MQTPTTHPRRWAALIVLAAAQFVVIMDTSIIGVALPDIQTTLGFSPSSLSWVFNAYVVAFGGLLLLGGKLSDVFGARRLFASGFALLAVGSLVAGLADSTGAEIAGRALQGAAAALIAPSALTMVMVLFSHDPGELTKAMGLYGAAAPAGGTAGVFLGGVLTQGLDWRYTLLINIPLAITVLAATPWLLPSAAGRRGRIDLAGAVTITSGLAVLVFGIVRANTVGWGAPQTLLSIAGGAVLIALFVWIQARRQEPLMNLSIFHVPNLAAANVVTALLGAAWIPMWFTGNLWLQQVLGAGPFAAGAALLPMTVVLMVVMIGAIERIVMRVGFKAPMVGGMAILAGGIALFATLPANGGGYLGSFLPASLVAALGMSLTFIPALMASIGAAPPEQGGLASGMFSTSYQIGSALGLAALTALSISLGASHVGDARALTHGFHAAFLGGAGIALAGSLAALALIRTPAAIAVSSRDEVQHTDEAKLAA